MATLKKVKSSMEGMISAKIKDEKAAKVIKKKLNFVGIFFYFFVLYSALFHLPPLRFHCVDGCRDRTQDRCN